MPTLNLGIVADVDAGKTTLTERLLFETGVTTHIGRVDHGDTTTDADALERQRGITIRSAVVTFTIDASASPGAVPGTGTPTKVNLIDTPGHSDFVAEVERALAVLDGAVLVVSAVEGVQAQTRVLIRIMERLGIPFLIFANKIDRAGASYEGTLDALREALTGAAIVADGAGVRRGGCRRLTPWDEALLRDYVDRRPPGARPGAGGAHRADPLGRVHPVLFGAALAGSESQTSSTRSRVPPQVGAVKPSPCTQPSSRSTRPRRTPDGVRPTA